MSLTLLLRRLRLEGREFISSKELEAYCKEFEVRYETAVRYYLSRGYIVRIFRGLFYVRTPEEVTLGRRRYNHLQLVANGLRLKHVMNWYYGLNSALKLNNMTHEHFPTEEVLNDKIFRRNPITIDGYKFRFRKIKSNLFGFGVIKDGGGLRYSDPEKTVLDFIYIWRYNGVPEEKIILDISERMGNISLDRIKAYAVHYPKTVFKTLEKVLG
ncbi:MAG: hypothetical protein DRI26_03615 [Chloroflexi bacterium]|nr:MAG: hypothetical protein DRI26_03615 [Chloroflexota bacterium]